MATYDPAKTPALADDESLELDFTAYLARGLDVSPDAVERALGRLLLTSHRMRKTQGRIGRDRPQTHAA